MSGASGNWLSFRNTLLGEHTPPAGRHAAKTTQHSSGRPSLRPTQPSGQLTRTSSCLNPCPGRTRSWFTPPFGSGGRAFRVFWELQASTGGRLQHRKGTNSPTLAPGPCRRQLEQHAYQEPKLGNNKYVEQQGTDRQRNAGRPRQWNSTPFKSSWGALNYTGRMHRIFSEEAANTMLSLSLCTHSRAHACVYPRAHLRACVSTASGKAQRWVKPLVTDGWWTGYAHGRQAPISSVSQITS